MQNLSVRLENIIINNLIYLAIAINRIHILYSKIFKYLKKTSLQQLPNIIMYVCK